MRWAVVVALLLGELFAVAPFVPAAAGQASWLRPFAWDSRPVVAIVGGLPGRPGGCVTALLAGLAAACFLAALAGLFWRAVPVRAWPALVAVAIASSLLLDLAYFGKRMLAPMLVDGLLAWGVASGRWTAGVLPARALDGDPARIHPLMHVPVPWVYVLTYVAGVGVQQLVPLAIRPAGIRSVCLEAGVAVALAGALIAFAGLGLFRTVGTTTVPFGTPSTLVTRGPYRFTRNPMYVGLALLYVGVAGTQALIWPVVLLPLVLLYVDRVVIPGEEARLGAAFGEAYRDYRARVRRWI